MELGVDYLQADKLSGVLSYRRRFPKELVRFIPSASPTQGGRRELKKSLRARDMNAPGALDRYVAAEREYNALVQQAKKLAKGTFDKLDEPLIEYLAAKYVRNQLALDEAGRWRRQGPEFRYASRENPEEDYEECRALLDDHDGEGLVVYWADWACSYAQALGGGYRLDRGDPLFPVLCQALGEAACKLWLELDNRFRDGRPKTPPEPVEPKRAALTSTGIGQGPTLDAVAQALMASRANPVNPPTAAAWGTALRFFREAHGPIPADQISRRMVTEWIELLAKRPARLPKDERRLPLRDLVRRYEDRTDVPTLAKKTIRASHLASLSAIWNKAQEAGDIDEGLANPFKSRQALAGSPEEERGSEFSMPELHAIFSLPVFTEGERPVRGRGEACYWIPLLLLTTGARPEEVAQLLVSDFVRDAETGRWLMSITDRGDHPIKGKRSLKSNSRTFTVPALLLELGLAEYLAQLRAQGETALFPRLSVKNKRSGYLTPSLGEWWSGYLRTNGVTLTDPSGKTRRPLRDFRPTWTTAARECGVPEEAISYLMGHSNARAVTTRRYGSREAYGLWMENIQFPKLDMSSVKPWDWQR